MRWLWIAVIGVSSLAAQAPADSPEWIRATTTHRLAEFPKIHPDGSVWFQFQAPGAQKVQVWIVVPNKTYDMQKNADGVWDVRIPYPGPGLQLYWMIVDGVQTPDPNSDVYYSNGYRTMVEVPAPGALLSSSNTVWPAAAAAWATPAPLMPAPITATS